MIKFMSTGARKTILSQFMKLISFFFLPPPSVTIIDTAVNFIFIKSYKILYPQIDCSCTTPCTIYLEVAHILTYKYNTITFVILSKQYRFLSF